MTIDYDPRKGTLCGPLPMVIASTQYVPMTMITATIPEGCLRHPTFSATFRIGPCFRETDFFPWVPCWPPLHRNLIFQP